METYIKAAEDLDTVNTHFIPLLLDAVLGDYNRNIPIAREPEVLHLMSVIVSRLGVCLSIGCIFYGFADVLNYVAAADSPGSGDAGRGV
jgi:hypothetical protein